MKNAEIHNSSDANLRHLIAAWVFFILSFIILARVPFGLIAVLFVSLVFQQYLSGVIHEAAHWHLYRKNQSLNDRIGTWGASFVFGYSVKAYRKEHFKHHASKIFLADEDGETAEYLAGSRREMIGGILRDLFFVTAAKMVRLRLSPMFEKTKEGAAGNEQPDRSFRHIVLLSACLWGFMALASSFWAVALFWLSFFTLYPLSNRIRVYATHGDITQVKGAYKTEVAVNVLSPVYERIFFGNRMMMYHFEHHQKPNLPFREIEKMAWKRHADEGGGNARISVPSYLFSLRLLIFSR